MPRVEFDEITNAKLGRLEAILREPGEQIVDRALADYLVNGEGSYLLAVIHTPEVNGSPACTIEDVIGRMDAFHDLYGRMADAEDGVEVAFMEIELATDIKPQLAFLPKTLPEIAALTLGTPAADLDDIVGFVSERCGLSAEAVLRRAVNWYLTLGGGGSMLSKPDIMPMVDPILPKAQVITDKRRPAPTCKDSLAVSHGTSDRIAIPVDALTEAEVEAVKAARITTTKPYDLSDIPNEATAEVLAILDKVPDVPPDEGDELPPGFKR